jgi:alpha-glucosidase
MPTERVKRLLGRLRSQDKEPTVDSHATQRARPRAEFSWNDLKLNLKMLLVKSNVVEALYEELLIPSLSGQFDKELYVRWLQTVCLVPFFRHEAVNKQLIDSNIQATLRLRQRLMPYLRAVVALSRDYKWPMLKSLDKVEPDNPKAKGIDDCYVLGGALLVAPVIVPGAIQRYVYLPAGKWYNYWDNKLADGSQYVAVDAPLVVLPIFVRAGTTLPIQQDSIKDIEGNNQTLLYRIYPGDQETVLYEDDTEGFDKERNDYRWLYITCGWEEGAFVIKRRIAGQYTPSYTNIRVEIVGLDHEPLRIQIDRRPAPLWYFDRGILEFTTETFQIIEVVMSEPPETW